MTNKFENEGLSKFRANYEFSARSNVVEINLKFFHDTPYYNVPQLWMLRERPKENGFSALPIIRTGFSTVTSSSSNATCTMNSRFSRRIGMIPMMRVNLT